MHPLFEKASGLTETIIAAAIEVHRDQGPGLIESIYEWCLVKELGLRGLGCVSQKTVVIRYKGFTREEPLRLDVLVEACVLVFAVDAGSDFHRFGVIDFGDPRFGRILALHVRKKTAKVDQLQRFGSARRRVLKTQ